MVFTWHSVVTETMNRILDQDGSDLQWQPDHTDLPTDSTVCICSDLHETSSITFMLAVQSVKPPLTTAWWMQDAHRLARSQVESAHAIFDRQQFLDVALHRLVSTERKPLAVIEHKRR